MNFKNRNLSPFSINLCNDACTWMLLELFRYAIPTFLSGTLTTCPYLSIHHLSKYIVSSVLILQNDTKHVVQKMKNIFLLLHIFILIVNVKFYVAVIYEIRETFLIFFTFIDHNRTICQMLPNKSHILIHRLQNPRSYTFKICSSWHPHIYSSKSLI